MPTCGLLIGCVLLAGQAATPTVELSACTTRPHVGQEITLTLQVELAPGQLAAPAELTIPWLAREFGFHWSTPPADWLREQEQRREGLEVRLAGPDTVIRLEPTPPKPGETQGRQRLVWKLVVAEPDSLNRGLIVFAPVRLKIAGLEAVSKPLTLEVQKLPLRPANLPRLFLGVGDLRLEADVSAGEVDAGGELSLTLRVRGGGAAGRVERPAVADLWPAALQDSVRIEPGRELSESYGKAFTYLLRPRRPGRLELPAIHYAVFDPERGVYVAHQTQPLSFVVRRPIVDGPGASLPYAKGEAPERLRAVHLAASAVEPRVLWPRQAAAFLLLVSPPALFLGLWLKRRHWFPDEWGTQRQRWSAAAARAVRALRALDGASAERVAVVLCGYLRERFALETVELTPKEAVAALRQAGLDGVLTTRVAEFLEQLSAERFGPGEQLQTDLPRHARELIHRLDGAA